MEEMECRGYEPASEWKNKNYRGKACAPYKDLEKVSLTQPIYPEHDREYMDECLKNLQAKDIYIEVKLNELWYKLSTAFDKKLINTENLCKVLT